MSRQIHRTAMTTKTLEEAIDAMSVKQAWCIRMVLRPDSAGRNEDEFWEVFQTCKDDYEFTRRYGANPNVYCRESREAIEVFSVSRSYVAAKVQKKLFVGWSYELSKVSAMYFDWGSNKHVEPKFRGGDCPVETLELKPAPGIPAWSKATLAKALASVPGEPRKRKPKKKTKEQLFEEKLDRLAGPKLTPLEAYAKTKPLHDRMEKRKNKSDW